MEKVCEFCTDLRPLVYCKADAAYLCLSCDSKVHFANALSSRHLRTLVCNSCRYHLAYVQCLDHKILICQECDQKLHDVSLPHRKRAIRSFMGCPSAKDFAMLWCFGLNEMENITCEDLFGSASCVSADSNMAQASVRARSRISSKAKLHGGSSSRQGKSPPRSNQLWSQNIQDLGICEELVCRDDFNIPDVDLTFQNFEELFGDQDPVRALLDDNDVSCSSLEKDMSIDKSDIDNLSAIEDSSAAISITILQSARENKDIDSTNIQHYPRSTDPPHTIRPFESTVSSSVSRFWAASSPTYHNDGALSPCSEEKGYLGNSAELEISHMEATQNLTLTYEEKPSRR